MTEIIGVQKGGVSKTNTALALWSGIAELKGLHRPRPSMQFNCELWCGDEWKHGF